MAHHEVQNNPIKEVATALVGIVLLLTIIGGIAVAGWLRPAGQHYPAGVEPIQSSQTDATLVNGDSTTTSPAQDENAGETVVPVTTTQATTTTAAPVPTEATTPPAKDKQ